jgi:hypothetical protein
LAKGLFLCGLCLKDQIFPAKNHMLEEIFGAPEDLQNGKTRLPAA